MLKRLGITLMNIFFPPLAVACLTGLGPDTLINSALFLLAVIPSHVHGFYISLTYFGRKNKVRKGQDPGSWRRGIYSEKVQYGGASRSEVRRIREGLGKKGSGGLGSKVGSLVRRVSGSGTSSSASPVTPTSTRSRTGWKGSQKGHKRRENGYGRESRTGHGNGVMGRLANAVHAHDTSSGSDSGSDYTATTSSRLGSRRIGNRLSGANGGSSVPMRQSSQRSRY